MPPLKSVETLESLCVMNVLENLETVAQWDQFVYDKANPGNRQTFLNSLDLLRNIKYFKANIIILLHHLILLHFFFPNSITHFDHLDGCSKNFFSQSPCQ